MNDENNGMPPRDGAFQVQTVTSISGRPKPQDCADLTDLCPEYRVGAYRLKRELGRGGMGAVWLAERADGEIRLKVAIKFLRRELNDPELVQRFRHERQILADLKHSGIATLYDVGTSEAGRPYLVMEFVDGDTIDCYCYRRKLSLAQRLILFIRVCGAVSHAHGKGVIHGDLKPGNIMVNSADEPRLLDFGISRLESMESGAGQHEALVMTPEYASPEQRIGCPVTVASDIYALGLILFQLVTGSRPRELGRDHTTGIRSLMSGNGQDQAEVPTPTMDHLPPNLGKILLTALDPVPESRFQTVGGLVDGLSRLPQIKRE